MNNHDINVLEHIIRYCEEANDARMRFGNSIDALDNDAVYRNAIAMCILQIGELVGHPSDNFKGAYDNIPWQKIRGMRNIAAHHYGKFDTTIMFNTITERIPELLEFCEERVFEHTTVCKIRQYERFYNCTPLNWQ
jgi:uncharacterized protein with HEPN domain